MSNAEKQTEQLVSPNTTRRGFLARLARTASTAAAAMAGVLATRAAGAARGGGKTCCVYQCIDWYHGVIYFKTKCSGRNGCQDRFQGCGLIDSYPVEDCTQCSFY
jgi:hypothetical protein